MPQQPLTQHEQQELLNRVAAVTGYANVAQHAPLPQQQQPQSQPPMQVDYHHQSIPAAAAVAVVAAASTTASVAKHPESGSNGQTRSPYRSYEVNQVCLSLNANSCYRSLP